jgi:nitrate/nitrite-specific signal transduction histidine kinase
MSEKLIAVIVLTIYEYVCVKQLGEQDKNGLVMRELARNPRDLHDSVSKIISDLKIKISCVNNDLMKFQDLCETIIQSFEENDLSEKFYEDTILALHRNDEFSEAIKKNPFLYSIIESFK